MIRLFQPVNESKRIKKAIQVIKKPFEFELQNIDEKTLSKIAAITNSAVLHCSGNCYLLSRVFLYNLKFGKTILSVNNTHPFYEGLDPHEIDRIFFDLPLSRQVFVPQQLDLLPSMILLNYHQTGERVFSISIDYTNAIWSGGHTLNAVVIGKEPRVVFVDAWKSLKHIYTVDELKSRYPHIINYWIESYPSPVLGNTVTLIRHT